MKMDRPVVAIAGATFGDGNSAVFVRPVAPAFLSTL